MPETVTPAAGGTQTEMVLGGGPPAPNGAAGTQVPAPAAVVSATAAAPVVDPKAPPPAEKTPEQVVAEKAAADKTAADAKAASEKTAADAKAATDKTWAEWKPTRGQGITTDDATFKEAVTAFREAGLSTEQAQKVIALNDKFITAQAQSDKAASDKFFADQRAEFIKRSASDKDYGGKLDEATKVQQKAFERFLGPDGLKELSERHPNIASDPVLFKAFYRVGLLMKDDSISGTAGGGVSAPTLQANLDAMYPSMARKS